MDKKGLYMAYFGSTPVFTGHKDDYTHDFKDQIANQQGSINKATGTYDQWKGQAEQAKGQYNDQISNQQSYQSMWDQAQKDNQVAEAQKQYQDSLSAVNATGSAMATLPSSINANSNVSLTNAQKNAMLGNQMMKYQNTMGFWNAQNAQDQARYQDMLRQANIQAQGNYQNQRDVIADRFNDYRQQMGDLQNQANNVLNEKNLLRNIYAQMYDDEYHHMDDAYRAWADNLQAETSRYGVDAQERMHNADLALQREAQKQAQDLQRYLIDLQTGANAQPTFEQYLSSNAGMENQGWAPGMDEDAMKNSNASLLGKLRSGSMTSRDWQNVQSGDAYQSYKKWLDNGGDGRTMKDLGGFTMDPREAMSRAGAENQRMMNKYLQMKSNQYDRNLQDATNIMRPFTRTMLAGNPFTTPLAFTPVADQLGGRFLQGMTGGGWSKNDYLQQYMGGL